MWISLKNKKSATPEVRQSAENELNKMADSGSSEGAMRMKTLTQLASACGKPAAIPRLVEPEFPADQSAKLNAFRELLYTSLEGGHRMLVFFPICTGSSSF